MPGDIKYKDMNDDGMIDGSDQCELSPYGSTPGIMYGFGSTIRYKKFDLGFFFQGAAQRKIMISGIHPFGNTRKNVLQFIADDYWSESIPIPMQLIPVSNTVTTQTITAKTVATGYATAHICALKMLN